MGVFLFTCDPPVFDPCQVMKVDNHIHLAAAMTPRQLLALLGLENTRSFGVTRGLGFNGD
jgi:hypothetical protein